MDGYEKPSDRRVAEIIEQRVGAGESDLVVGWQQMLAGLLEKMAPFLSAGRLVTFRTLLPEEKTFFEALHRDVVVPGHVTALFISPSVRHQMMGGQPPADRAARTSQPPDNPPDAGILLACGANDYQTIVNALFAHPPHTPAIDVYERGRLAAGYSYASIADCRGEISAILQRHLPPATDTPG
jgi:hypothetical protein